jgi:four helix bundle protein
MDSEEKFGFERLRVYQDSLNFSKEIYKVTKNFPEDELFGITSQLRRSALSVCLNIAEGSSLTKTEFKNFLRRSRGSVCECVPLLSLSLDNRYIPEAKFKELNDSCLRLAKAISALINSVK